MGPGGPSVLPCLWWEPLWGGDEDLGSIGTELGHTLNWTRVPIHPVSTSCSLFLRRKVYARDRPPINFEEGGIEAFKRLGNERLRRTTEEMETPVPSQRKKIGTWPEFYYFHTCRVLLGVLFPIIESRRYWGPLSRRHPVYSSASS